MLLSTYLKGIVQDCTFEQHKIHEWYQLQVARGNPIYSLDATAMTDRLPMLLQIIILYHLTRDWQLVYHWMKVMVGLPFELVGKKFLYNTGQGIGTYSS